MLLVKGLKHNLSSVGQLCDRGFRVTSKSLCCYVVDIKTNKILLIKNRKGNVYVVYLDDLSSNDVFSWLRRLRIVGCGTKS